MEMFSYLDHNNAADEQLLKCLTLGVAMHRITSRAKLVGLDTWHT